MTIIEKGSNRRHAGRFRLNAALMLSGLLLLLIFTGCDLKLQAIILSPGSGGIVVAAGETVSFSGTAIGGTPFSDADGTTTSYGFSWDTDGNARTAATATGAASDSVEVTFEKVGVFTVFLTVTDSQGNSDRASVAVTVTTGEDSGQPLKAILLTPTKSPIQIVVGRTVTFKGIGAGGVPYNTAADSVDEPYGYFWDLAEIKTATVANNFRDVDISFNTTGLFNLAFTVKDSRGVVATTYIQVTVISG